MVRVQIHQLTFHSELCFPVCHGDMPPLCPLSVPSHEVYFLLFALRPGWKKPIKKTVVTL